MSQRFDAGTDPVSYTAANPPDPSGGFTLLGWARARVDTNTNATLARLHAASGASTTGTFATSVDGLGGPNYFTGGGTVTNTLGLVIDVWRKVAFACTGTTGKVYAAPVAGATTLVSGTIGGVATPTGVTLGGRSAADTTESFNGGLAYWRLWSTELNQAQIEAEWASPTAVVTSGLWASWPLETNLQDVSGNGRHLVAGSTATTTEDDPPITDTIFGTGVGSWGGWVGSGVGVRTVFGTGAGSWGGWSGQGTQQSAASVASGGWETLAAISREARQIYAEDTARVPTACPNDGEPLRTGPDGAPWCPWDGWRPGP